MSVHDAEPGDIYVDRDSKLWRIVSICHQPTVVAEEVEGTLMDPAQIGALPQQFGIGARASINKRRQGGGTGGLMWQGWKRIFRKERE